MLKNTFVHISGIGLQTEQQIWQAGCLDWQQFLDRPPNIGKSKAAFIHSHLAQQPQNVLETPDYFYQLLPPHQQWRIFPHFQHTTAFVDIETNGGHGEHCQITTICLYDGQQIFTFIKDHNLDEFPAKLAEYQILVTYNGKSFDAPIIERHWQIKLKQAHLDLRPILAAVGYKGGLKGCEEQLGIDRHNLKGVDGYSAVILWREYQRTGQQKYLDTLLAYNIADTINMEPLMIKAYNLQLGQTPFQESKRLPEPAPQKIPIKANKEVITALRDYQQHKSSYYR